MTAQMEGKRCPPLLLILPLKTDGFVEVELKGVAGAANTVVRRRVLCPSGRCELTLNGEAATGVDAARLMRSLRIDVDRIR